MTATGLMGKTSNAISLWSCQDRFFTWHCCFGLLLFSAFWPIKTRVSAQLTWDFEAKNETFIWLAKSSDQSLCSLFSVQKRRLRWKRCEESFWRFVLIGVTDCFILNLLHLYCVISWIEFIIIINNDVTWMTEVEVDCLTLEIAIALARPASCSFAYWSTCHFLKFCSATLLVNSSFQVRLFVLLENIVCWSIKHKSIDIET